MPEVQNTTYLSIGEVLGLLLAEFPDITISKIRFLESQGLIAPERTPSGYRKFYEPDVELLKVILREQRENYLPLRVIKDRIDSGAIDPSGEMTKPDGLPDIHVGHGPPNDTLPNDTAAETSDDGPERTVHETRHDTDEDTDEHASITAPTSTRPSRGRRSGGDDRGPSGFESVAPDVTTTGGSPPPGAPMPSRRAPRTAVPTARRRRRSCSRACSSRVPSCAR